MLRLIKTAALALLALLVAALGLSTWQFARYAPPDPPTAADRAALAWFIDDYAGARRDFLARGEALAARYSGVERFSIPVASPSGVTDLAVDALHVPAQVAPRRLLVISSGVHGVEGPAGSAVMRLFMAEFMSAEAMAETGVLFLHAMNPYGFAKGRRFTENNVDLNRNASRDDTLYRSVNAGYPMVDAVINPQGPADTGSLANRFFHLRAVALIAQHGMGPLRQAVLQGQYQVPKGIYFGGQALEPQLAALAPRLQPILDTYPLSMSIDLHTGYGARGKLHLFFDPPKDPRVRERLETVFAGQAIDWGSGADFYTVTGDVVGWLGTLRRAGLHLPAVFEYGTMDSQKTMGSIKSLHVTLLENQGVQHGYASAADEARIRRDYQEMFNPSSPAWRTKVIQDSRAMLRAVMANLPRVAPP
jgi:predicted deacylase